FPVEATITRSVATIKADAALRSFEASGDAITWAVIDSGVDASHPHFGTPSDHALHDPWVRNLHRCFIPVEGNPLADPDEEPVDGRPISKEDRDQRLELHRRHALEDLLGHGTHVAGIIAGRVPDQVEPIVLEKEERIVAGDEQDNLPKRKKITRERMVDNEREKKRFHGVAPGGRLVSLRVL